MLFVSSLHPKDKLGDFQLMLLNNLFFKPKLHPEDKLGDFQLVLSSQAYTTIQNLVKPKLFLQLS